MGLLGRTRGTCDLCNTECSGKVIAARKIASAVERGFLPAQVLSALDVIGRLKWRASAINGRLSRSDWLVCDSCMEKLKTYF
jgi:hypothetical protein